MICQGQRAELSGGITQDKFLVPVLTALRVTLPGIFLLEGHRQCTGCAVDLPGYARDRIVHWNVCRVYPLIIKGIKYSTLFPNRP